MSNAALVIMLNAGFCTDTAVFRPPARAKTSTPYATVCGERTAAHGVRVSCRLHACKLRDQLHGGPCPLMTSNVPHQSVDDNVEYNCPSRKGL